MRFDRLFPKKLFSTKEGRAVFSTAVDQLLGLADDLTKKKPGWNAFIKGLRAGAKVGGVTYEWMEASRPDSQTKPAFDSGWEQRKVAEYVDRASDNQLFGDAVDAQFAKRLGVRISDSTRQLIAKDPELSELLRQAGITITRDGSAFVNVGKATAEMEDELESVRKVVEDISGKLDEVLAAQAKQAEDENQAVAWDGSAQQAKTKEELQDELRQWRHELAGAGAAVSLLSQLVGFIDPRAGNALSVVGTATIDVANAVLDYLNNRLEFPDLATSSGLILTGNIAGAVMSIAKVFLAGVFPPSIEDQILAEVRELREDVRTLNKEMHERFDRLEERFVVLFDVVLDGFNDLNLRTRRIDNGIGHLAHSLSDVQQQLGSFERDITEFIQDTNHQSVWNALNLGIGYSKTTGRRMSRTEFINFENTFYTHGVTSAVAASWSVGPQLSQRSSDVLAELRKYPLDVNMNYVLKLAGVSADTVANPVEWKLAADAYTRLYLENGRLAAMIDPGRLQRLYAVGRASQ